MLTTTTNRLFIVYPIAGIILAFLFGAVAILCLILWYTHEHISVLFEEPVGLLGHAGLLVNSVVSEMTRGVRNTSQFHGKMLEDVMKSIDLFYGPTAQFVMEERSDASEARITMQTKDSTRRNILRPPCN